MQEQRQKKVLVTWYKLIVGARIDSSLGASEECTTTNTQRPEQIAGHRVAVVSSSWSSRCSRKKGVVQSAGSCSGIVGGTHGRLGIGVPGVTRGLHAST
ncbi:hypothetical protein HPB50_019087 [Hyalomma asiaticum]|uniref:Uncharacterized protein n=1 Tax=Hyalomma asiaticum TaxID=266040 RepID=A0ACB7RLW2_HYAAI|nr:hypothetical protein HPB50_019087 [Hyalomma asiaticum]